MLIVSRKKPHMQQNKNVEKKHLLCVLRVLWFTVRRKMSMCGKACLKKIWLPCSHLDIKLWNSLEVVLWILQHAALWSFANRNRAYTYIPWWFYYEILIEKKNYLVKWWAAYMLRLSYSIIPSISKNIFI